MAIPQPNTTVPLDGRLTSLEPYTATLLGDELLYIVAPGNAQLGNSYAITAANLAQFIAGLLPVLSAIITDGATLAAPYDVLTTDTGVGFNKSGTPSASYAVCPLADDMKYPNGVLFKDLLGDADVNNVTVTFTAGELCDGLAQVQITSSYGWFRVFPTPGGGSWFMA
jgi:hypothetical protein